MTGSRGLSRPGSSLPSNPFDADRNCQNKTGMMLLNAGGDGFEFSWFIEYFQVYALVPGCCSSSLPWGDAATLVPPPVEYLVLAGDRVS